MNVEGIRLKNIKLQQNNILQKVFNLASEANYESTQIQQLNQNLIITATTIEKICYNQQATPASLTPPSRRIYSWIKFLTNEHYLELHLRASSYVLSTAKEILNQRGQKSLQLMIGITNLAGLYQGKRNNSTANIMISEGFINAPKVVLQALVESALFGKNQQNTQLIRSFVNTEGYTNVVSELDLIIEVVAENPQGKFYNLDELFNKINHEYFAASLAKPRLAWSRINTYRKFGHYETARDRVVMSLTLDNPKVPEFVVKFVLYHELLHKYYGTKLVHGKKMVHTKEFRASESQFKSYDEASRWLTKLASSRFL
ncbi:M48 family peptidase [Nostoc sp. CENA67]|uniref:M48 family peptidase n=1 Tax=Amazonocrinis nigriterrae CENA67 TaxID=2794033 RepID=A0A8J7LBK5_9NOST|nr:M48 family peptidase [Amazonocrinis nigriterrae]MBH8565486.1 M48 family peptidase [Amazonocrinis nigriterrae CENA67]